MMEGFKYLGLHMVWDKSRIRWFHVLVKISSGIKSSNGKRLSQAGRTCLFNSVNNVMANYVMSFFKMPTSIIY